jgi:Leucine-rich repeat (LRR) protein
VFCCPNSPDEQLDVVVNCFTQQSWIRPPPHGNLSNDFGSEGLEKCGGYHVVQENSCLSRVPENMCTYTNNRALVLPNNSIALFPQLSCLTRLRHLNLSFNLLKVIPKDAFEGFQEHIAEVSWLLATS